MADLHGNFNETVEDETKITTSVDSSMDQIQEFNSESPIRNPITKMDFIARTVPKSTIELTASLQNENIQIRGKVSLYQPQLHVTSYQKVITTYSEESLLAQASSNSLFSTVDQENIQPVVSKNISYGLNSDSINISQLTPRHFTTANNISPTLTSSSMTSDYMSLSAHFTANSFGKVNENSEFLVDSSDYSNQLSITSTVVPNVLPVMINVQSDHFLLNNSYQISESILHPMPLSSQFQQFPNIFPSHVLSSTKQDSTTEVKYNDLHLSYENNSKSNNQNDESQNNQQIQQLGQVNAQTHGQPNVPLQILPNSQFLGVESFENKQLPNVPRYEDFQNVLNKEHSNYQQGHPNIQQLKNIDTQQIGNSNAQNTGNFNEQKLENPNAQLGNQTVQLLVNLNVQQSINPNEQLRNENKQEPGNPNVQQVGKLDVQQLGYPNLQLQVYPNTQQRYLNVQKQGYQYIQEYPALHPPLKQQGFLALQQGYPVLQQQRYPDVQQQLHHDLQKQANSHVPQILLFPNNQPQVNSYDHQQVNPYEQGYPATQQQGHPPLENQNVPQREITDIQYTKNQIEFNNKTDTETLNTVSATTRSMISETSIGSSIGLNNSAFVQINNILQVEQSIVISENTSQEFYLTSVKEETVTPSHIPKFVLAIQVTASNETNHISNTILKNINETRSFEPSTIQLPPRNNESALHNNIKTNKVLLFLTYE